MYIRLLLIISLLLILVSCNSIIDDKKHVTERLEVENFILEVTTPNVIKQGQTLRVKASLTYIGDETVQVIHGEPIIRIAFSGSNVSRNYTAIASSTQFKRGQIVDVEYKFKATELGKHNLLVKTAISDIDGIRVEGLGSPSYIKDDLDRKIKIHNELINLKPILIEVR